MSMIMAVVIILITDRIEQCYPYQWTIFTTKLRIPEQALFRPSQFRRLSTKIKLSRLNIGKYMCFSRDITRRDIVEKLVMR